MDGFSLQQLLLAALSSGVLSTFLTLMFSRKKDMASVEQTMRETYGGMIVDLRVQTAFLSEQIKISQDRERDHLAIIVQQNGTVSSIQAELSVSQTFIRSLESQKQSAEQKILKYEAIIKRGEFNQKV